MADEAHVEYWQEALLDSFEQAELFESVEALSEEQRRVIANRLAAWASEQSMAFVQPGSGGPPNFEAQDLRQRLAEQEARADRDYQALRQALARRLGVESERISVDRDAVLYNPGNSLPYEIG